ncbi:MAG: membrane protein insertion efficiency factor YidD [Desulfobacteraceae bacterium]|jgi:putative component of membrane protein insertase Oxa1/YidC/SpoIIIJ protein YidD
MAIAIKFYQRHRNRIVEFIPSAPLVAMVLFTSLACLMAPRTASAEPPALNNSTPKASTAWSTPLKLFQMTISKADGNRCPMYPSCSHYSSQAFARHNPVMAWILTADRLLRCGRDETRLSKPVIIQGRIRIKDTLADNTFWWSSR